MKTLRPRNVDEYLAGLPRDVQMVLRRVRDTLRKAVPDAEEAISYGIPAYKLQGRPVIYFAGWKEHFSLYPSGSELVKTFKTQLARYEVAKGTIRFPLSETVPVKLIAAVATFRAKEVAEQQEAKKAASKKRAVPRGSGGVGRTVKRKGR